MHHTVSRLLLLSMLAVLAGAADAPANKPFSNPILPGFYPDPSLCRVGDTYYLVNSSFEWFPGVPIHRSKDLVNWEQIGHVLDRPSQLAMKEGMKASRGIWAPTIRYHDGLFYMITTAQDSGGNFYVTARDPSGPWSEPVWLKNAPGIDPSLFWDDDGTCWFTAAGWIEGGARWPNENRIYLQQLDTTKGQLVGERHTLTSGHAANARWTEGPHLFKRNGKYVLLIAEGGTGHHHAVTIHHADKITGPYIPDHANPVLTHRHLGLDAPIGTTGHADLVETQHGEWWSVMLGVRTRHRNNLLGRETFLTPVAWEGQTLVYNPGIGRVLESDRRPALPWSPVSVPPARDEFTATKLGFQWNFLRTPFETWWSLEKQPGSLSLQLRPQSVTKAENPSLVARRIQHFHFRASTRLTFSPATATETAGLVAMQNDRFHYRLLLRQHEGRTVVSLRKMEAGVETEVASLPWSSPDVVLALEGNLLAYTFMVGSSLEDLRPIGPAQDARVCGTTRAGGFIGPFVGMYASSEGQPSTNTATFDWFEYLPDPVFSK
jgi:alpha-N-arabinofuranosidase